MHSAYYYADDGRARLALPRGRCLLPSCSESPPTASGVSAAWSNWCCSCFLELSGIVAWWRTWSRYPTVGTIFMKNASPMQQETTFSLSMLLVSKTTTSSSIFSQSASWNALSFTLLERVLISSATHILSDQVSPSWDSLTDRTPSTDFGKYLLSFLTLYWFVHHLNNRFCDKILLPKMA